MINRLKRRVGSLVRQTLVRLLPGMASRSCSSPPITPTRRQPTAYRFIGIRCFKSAANRCRFRPNIRSGRITAHLLKLGAEREGRLRDHAPHLA